MTSMRRTRASAIFPSSLRRDKPKRHLDGRAAKETLGGVAGIALPAFLAALHGDAVLSVQRQDVQVRVLVLDDFDGQPGNLDRSLAVGAGSLGAFVAIFEMEGQMTMRAGHGNRHESPERRVRTHE